MMKQDIVHDLLAINAISIAKDESYTWKSGIKSPIYLDTRLIISYPKLRKKIIENLKQLVIDNYNLSDIKIIFGTATAGIAPAILLSESLNLPSGYVRAKSKEHGQNKRIEGYYQEKWKAIVVEDTVSTGSSVLNVVETLRQAKVEVLGVIAIFSYDLKIVATTFNKEKIKFNSLINFHDLLENQFVFNQATKQQLISFYHKLNR